MGRGKGCGNPEEDAPETNPPQSVANNDQNHEPNKSTTVISDTAKTEDVKVTFEEDDSSAMLAQTLAKIPILKSLKGKDRRTLASALTERSYADGEDIITEGEIGKEFYIIQSGECLVLKENTDKKDGDEEDQFEVARLKAADYFGEQALQADSTRGATVRAVNGPAVCWILKQEEFLALFRKIKFPKRVAISAETDIAQVDEKNKHIPKDAIRQKTPAQKSMILKALGQSILFAKISTQQREAIVNEMWLKSAKTGEDVIVQGDMGDNFYVVQNGSFDIFVYGAKVTTCKNGQSFGELALMYNAPRAATVTATQPSELWALDRWTFRNMVQTTSQKKLEQIEDKFLTQVDEFKMLLASERARIAEALDTVTFAAGHTIISQGDTGDRFYIILQGTAEATQANPNGAHLAPIQLCQYSRGECFGERALIKNEKRAATVTATTEVECLFLTTESFNRLLGPLEEIFNERMKGYATAGQQTNKRRRLKSEEAKQAAMNNNDNQRSDLKLADLQVLGTLGKGSFGLVQLVHDQNNNTYALKKVSKAKIIQSGQQKHILSEKKVMAMLNHPFCIKLHATFKTTRHLYFLLEPSLGGELFSVLRKNTFFDEYVARFFAAGVVLAFEYIHSLGIVYRDLKPENLLLAKNGYLKITDFGFAKVVGDERTWTLCGTSDYLAPEVISGQGHGKGVDWWTLGILIFEMLASYPPFYDEDPMKTYGKIMHSIANFPIHFSRTAKDLVKRLLTIKPTRRLGVTRGGAQMIKEHPWFYEFDWEVFEAQKMPAPILMPVENDMDLSNFDRYPDEPNDEEYFKDPKPGWDDEF